MLEEGTPILCLFSFPTRELEDYMSDRVQFVITAQDWDPSFEEVSPRGAGKGGLNPPCLPSNAPRSTGPHMHPTPRCRP